MGETPANQTTEDIHIIKQYPVVTLSSADSPDGRDPSNQTTEDIFEFLLSKNNIQL